MLKKRQSHSRRQLEAWLQMQAIVADAVADVGGRKLPVKDRVKVWQVQRYDILDLPEFDLNLAWDLKELYEIAFCLETLEFVFNPFQALTNLRNLLKPGGVMYASFHFLYPHHGPAKGFDCLRYTRWGIERLLGAVGFSEWQIFPRRFKHLAALYAFYTREGMFKRILDNLNLIHTEQGYMVKAFK